MIRIVIDGVSYSGWTSVSFQRSLAALSGSFEITLADEQTGKDWRFAAQKRCDIYIDLVKIMTGYVDSVSFAVTADSHSVALRGRDITSDLIDSSVVADKKGTPFAGTLKGADALSIIKTLVKPFDVKVKRVGEAGEKFARFATLKGETVFEALDRVAKQRGFILITDEEGTLFVTQSGVEKSVDSLKYGENILEAHGSYEYANRFRHYRVETDPVSDGSQNLWGSSVSAKWEDKEITRQARLLHVSAEADSTQSSCKKRASFEALYRAAASQVFTVVVGGWKQSDGSLWKANRTVFLDVPPLYLKDELLITAVTYDLSPEEGSKTSLTLMRKDAFNNARALEALAIKDSKGTKVNW